MSYADQVSPTRITVVLDKPSDWDECVFLLERQARGSDIWQHINPALEAQPTLPTKPIFPEVNKVNDGATSPKDLDSDQIKVLSILIDEYKTMEKEYRDYVRAAIDIEKEIFHTVTRYNLSFIRKSATLYE